MWERGKAEQGCAFMSLCGPLSVMYSISYACLGSLFRVSARTKTTTEEKQNMALCLNIPVNSQSTYFYRHFNLKQTNPDKNHRESSETKIQAMFLVTDSSADSSRKRIRYSRTERVDSSTQAHYNLTFWSVWPSSLSQTLPPFVALGPLWQCIDSLRCINPSDTGWMDSCWQDAPCHFVCCHLIRAPQFALLLLLLLSSPAHAHWGQVLSDIMGKVSCTFAINCLTKESKFP